MQVKTGVYPCNGMITNYQDGVHIVEQSWDKRDLNQLYTHKLASHYWDGMHMVERAWDKRSNT